MTASSSSQCQTAQTDLGRVGKGARRQRATSPHRTNARAVPTSRQMPEPSRPNSGTDLASRVTRGHGAQERAFAHPKFSFALYSLSLLLSFFFSFRCPFARGVRSAGGAWMHATHPDRHAMTGVRTPHRSASPSRKPALRSLRTTGPPWPRSICANRAMGPICVEASCVPSDRHARLAALHVGFLARARARRCPACPPSSCGRLIGRTGHRYPEERVSRASPARSLAAPGTPQPRSALQGRP
jgi:hypothetical protein